jgi:hypothetical protein
MFADWELIGVPKRLVISDKSLDKSEIEAVNRQDVNQNKALSSLLDDQKLDDLIAWINN